MFENIAFKGQFRSYQQKILDNADRYLSDGRIHIVAAPGSGKTILGLELIRRLESPCLILSPTTTIRNQWCDRFNDNFVKESDRNKFTSVDLKELNLITSATYQALYFAMKKAKEDGADYSSFDMIGEIKRKGIKTICLDEAHHLQNEWQKALENFIKELEGQIKIISLTATPPYDSSPNEWKRYIGVCGEIDEEIFVPELVSQQTLCPHQDYIYFNFSTKEETASFKSYRENVDVALNEFLKTNIFKNSYDRLIKLSENYDFLYSNVKEIVSLLTLYQYGGIDVDKKLIKIITADKNLPKLTLEYAEIAVNFLINSTLCNDYEKKSILELFKSYGLYEKGTVAVNLNLKLKRRLISSVGKLKSISTIVTSEYQSKKDDLRLLILTDFIKKESLANIGTDNSFSEVSIVSVFETVRRTNISVGAVSGSLIILPDECISHISGIKYNTTQIENTNYSIFDIHADNIEKVRIIDELFEQGVINVLVGTKSLLGEGWDAPCINTLILASFVGSFMLSNQMRGRAIRKDVNQPNKVANIWHLVTLERPHLYADKINEKLSLLSAEDKNTITSYDYETISRRFDCFVAPDYTTGEIMSGIERISIIKPPFDEKGIEKINNEMLQRAKARDLTAAEWKEAVQKSTTLNDVSTVKKEKQVPKFVFLNIAKATFLLSIFIMAFVQFILTLTRTVTLTKGWAAVVVVFAICICAITGFTFINLLLSKLLAHSSPEKSLRTLAECIMKAMQEKEIISYGTKVKTMADKEGTAILIELINASIHDQNIFHTAIREMLSPIQNPRYLLIPTNTFGRKKLKYALACPEILGKRNEYADCLAKHLKKSLGKISVVYTRTETGRKLIVDCRKVSYISYNENVIQGISKRISHWE